MRNATEPLISWQYATRCVACSPLLRPCHDQQTIAIFNSWLEHVIRRQVSARELLGNLPPTFVFLMGLGVLGGIHHFMTRTADAPLSWRKCPDELQAQNDYRAVLVQLAGLHFDELNQRFKVASPEEDDEFVALGQVFDIVEPRFSPAFDDWVEHSPRALAPRLARAAYLFNRATFARGSDTAWRTETSQFDEMQALIAKAQTDLSLTLARFPNSKAAHHLQVDIDRYETPQGRKSADIHAEALAANDKCAEGAARKGCAPTADIWIAIANRLQPKWGGSWRDLAKLEAKAERSALDRYELKRLTSHIACAKIDENTTGDTPAEIDRKLSQLDKIIDRGPASMSCLESRLYVARARFDQLSRVTQRERRMALWTLMGCDLALIMANRPNSVKWAIERAERYHRPQDVQKRNALVQTAAELSPGAPEVLEFQAADAQDGFDFDAALALWRESLRVRPFEARTRLQYLQLLRYDTSHTAQTLAELETLKGKIEELDVDNEWLFQSVYFELGDAKKLERVTRSCATRQPTISPDVQCELFRADALIGLAGSAQELNPEHDAGPAENASAISAARSVGDNRRVQLEKAQLLLTQLEHYRTWEALFMVRAKLYFSQGDTERALDELELAAKGSPQDPQPAQVWRDAAQRLNHCDAIPAAAAQLASCGKRAICSADRITSLEILENIKNAQRCPQHVALLRL
jgi:tetratricopeptide (TPR) repeat protein